MTANAPIASERPGAHEVRTALASVVGETHVAAARPGDRVDGIEPLCIVRPADAAQVAAVVRECAAARLALVPSGLGRHLDVGGAARRCDVVLRLDRLAAVTDHHAADMTVTVEAGCPLARLQATVGEHGQQLPVDPPDAEATTVGGILAAHLSGPLRASQGTARDVLLGIEVVDASGAVVRGGGRVVKNVAGYDLPRLHVGALGSLGVIVSATFKLRPRPALERAAAIGCASPETAAGLALAVRDELDPYWLEIARATPGDGLPAGAAGRWLVAAGVAGIALEVEDALARIARVAGVRGHRAEIVADGAALRARLGGLALAPAAAVLRASTLPTGVAAALRALAEDDALGEDAVVFAHAASGVVRASVAEPAAVAPLLRRIRPCLESDGGSLVVERATPAVKHTLVGDADPWGDPGDAGALVQGIKRALDPHQLLAPGRLPGGV